MPSIISFKVVGRFDIGCGREIRIGVGPQATFGLLRLCFDKSRRLDIFDNRYRLANSGVAIVVPLLVSFHPFENSEEMFSLVAGKGNSVDALTWPQIAEKCFLTSVLTNFLQIKHGPGLFGIGHSSDFAFQKITGILILSQPLAGDVTGDRYRIPRSAKIAIRVIFLTIWASS